MRAVIQRVTEAQVTVDDEIIGSIGRGLLILLGVGPEDSSAEVEKLLNKVLKLRIFADADGKTNLDLSAVDGALLVVSQFTLFASCKKGNRPSFTSAAPPALANELYLEFVSRARERGVPVETGSFGADMKVQLTNDGPFTLWLDTDEL